MDINRLLSAIKNENGFFFHKKPSREIKELMRIYNLNIKEAALFIMILEHILGTRRYVYVENLLDSENVDYGSKEHLEIIKVLKSLEKKDLIILEKSGRMDILNPEIKIDEDVFNELVLKDDDFSKSLSKSLFSLNSIPAFFKSSIVYLIIPFASIVFPFSSNLIKTSSSFCKLPIESV